MKKILHILCVCLVTYFAQAQEQSQHQLFVGNAAVDYNNADNNLQMQMQIGTPMLSSLNTGGLQARVGFPYGVLYISPTFVIDGFEVSKGYFTDKVNIKWTLGNNQDKIKKINISRKELGSNNALQLIGSVGKDIFEYNDTQVEGGVLYEYRVEAVGVSNLNELYVNYIEGVGFRNPTATVSGSVTFEGGSPVQDVVLFAEANGVENTTAGSSLKIDDGFISIDNIEYDIPAKETTLQSWVTGFGDVFKFNTSGGYNVALKAGKVDANSIVFEIYIYNFLIRKITLSNSYPTGELDGLGNDIFKNISELTDTSFFHITAVLENLITPKFYVNGREINQTYIDEATIEGGVVAPSFAFENGYIYGFASADIEKLKKLTLGENYTGYIDEVRVWSRLLTNEEIRRDYRRYLSGAETALSMYLRLDENAGDNVYDLSRKGFRQNKNDGIFSQNIADGVSFSSTKPTRKQLGVFGVTDANGAYTISSIPYTGTGESFVITPSLGVHAFEPASQTVFLGSGSSVVNQLNFTDISSFKFNGRAVYNVQDVFNTIVLEGDELQYIDIEDFSYNKYKVTSNGAKITINKGEYYYEGGSVDSANGFYKDGKLKRYPVIGLADAFIYIDGTIVIGSNNQPVKTDADGKFSVDVPIGQHNVEVRKDGHTFAHNGFYPALDTFDFFEDQIDPTWFIDTTRISLVGKVVGGKIESDKPVGFGVEGAFSFTNNADTENEENEVVSSKNNIGVATIILKGDIETTTLDVVVTTNTVTGEYKASLIPYIYNIKKADLKIDTNSDINILTSVETLNLLAAPVLDSVSYTAKDGTELFSEAFHHQKSFRYNSAVTLKLLEQEFETTYSLGDESFDVSKLAVPLYLQNKDYSMVFEVTQDYINKDAGSGNFVETKEYYNEGQFNINNNLATAGDLRIKFARQGNVAQYLYTFRASKPNPSIDVGFKRNITIEYILADNTTINISNPIKSEGIVLGAIEPEGTVFVTVAPKVPDIILRDPPGSNSFASIEKGTTISFQKSNSKSEEGSVGAGLFVSLTPTFTSNAGTPFFSVKQELNVVSSGDTNFSKSQQLNQDGSYTETYEFKNTIRTSDSPLNVGADADLYIGNAKNEYYGICNKTFITTTEPVSNHNIVIDAGGKELYISFQKTYFVAEQPTNTFFVYTQGEIIETIIPNLIARADVAPPTTAQTSTGIDAPKTSGFYLAQVDLWKKIIQDNERDKYLALNERATLEAKLVAEIAIKNAAREERLSELKDLPFILQREYSLTEFDAYEVTLNNLIASNFQSNISIDAGVGEFTSSVSTSIITSKSYTKTIDMSTDFVGQLGLLVNNQGGYASLTGTSSLVDETGFSSEEDLTTTISYTLKDNDVDNFLAVDVVNLFDGFGPIFITKGGATSCPNEEVTVSNYYEHSDFNPTEVGAGGEELNAGTVAVYQSEITSKGVTQLTNIPESEGALFTLLLKNTSVTNSDLEYIIEVDALTLNGATTNVSSSGVNVYIPYNETVEFPFEVYKSSASGIFDYDNIRVYLKTPCDAINASDTFIDVSVEFKPSCSKVAISAPEDNFIFNRAEGYSRDANSNTTTNMLPITFTDFNTDFAGFEKIELQYRNASSANWIKFKTYYGTQTLLDQASDNEGIVIDVSISEYTFNWDVVGNQIPDGDYEFRAISYCTDDVTTISPIVSGTINLNAPVLFGTPQPSDGILDVGEDVSIRFNEDVQERVATSIKVSGLSNQQAIDHSVSVFLDGGANKIELPNQILPKGSFTLQFWYKNATMASGTLISQENGMNATLNVNQLTFSLGGKSVTATIDSSQYNFYSLVYQTGAEPQLLIFQNGTELELTGDTDLESDLDFNSNNSIFIGGNNVSGNIHDVRFWSKPFTPAQATVAKDKTLTGRELSLLGYWKLDEGNGKVAVDKAKSRNAIVNLGWAIKPKGTGYTFENDAYLSLEEVGFVQPTEVEDITLSFWVKTATASVGTIFSNGRGNDDESKQSNGFRNKWSVNMKADGNLELLSENISYNLTNVSVADDTWHHIALVLKRGGSLNAYVDALETSSVSSVNIGGFSNK